MPRRTNVYWINKALDLNKCRSRRCEEPAVKDHLCNKHWTAWSLAGFQPPMPRAYGGAPNDKVVPPLEMELREDIALMRETLNEIARLPTDEVSTLKELEETIPELEAEKAKLQRKRHAALAPLVDMHRRTKKWFEPAQQKVDEAIALAQQRLETTRRSTVRALAPVSRKAS